MNTSPEALLLSYQVAQSVRDLICHNPGDINIANIRRLSELLAFETFTDKVNNIERLTIAGKCILIDIDFAVDVVDNVHFSIVKLQESSKQQKNNDDPESLAKNFLWNLKDYFSFTGEHNSPKDILFNCLIDEAGDLRKFCSSLQFLGLLDRLSVSRPNSKTTEKLENSIFNYLRELQFLFGYFSAVQNKLEIANIVNELLNFKTNEKNEFVRKLKESTCAMYDVLNGYTNFGQVINNLNGDNIGIFIKFWQDNRLMTYQPKLKKCITGEIEDTNLFLQGVFQQYEKDSNVNKILDKAKYVKLSSDYHYQRSLPSLYKLARQNDEILKKKQEECEDLNIKESDLIDYLNLVSAVKLPFYDLRTLKDLDCQCCLSLEFLDYFYLPVATIREYFGSKVIYFEKESNAIMEDLNLENILESLNEENSVQFDINFQINKVPGLSSNNECIKTVLSMNYVSESPLKKISKINIYDQPVKNKKTGSNSYLLGSNYLEDTISEASLDDSIISAPGAKKAVLLDEPLLTKDSAIFLKVNSNTNEITMNVVSSADSIGNQDLEQINLLAAIESIFIELRSLSLIYNLISSMMKGDDTIKPIKEKCVSHEKNLEAANKKMIINAHNDPKRLSSVARRRSSSASNKTNAISKRSSSSQKSDLLQEFMSSYKAADLSESIAISFSRISERFDTVMRKDGASFRLKIITNHNIFSTLLNNKASKTISLDIFNGRICGISLFVESIGLDINTMNSEDESKFPEIFNNLQKLQEFLTITEDLYYFICLLLKK